MSYLDELRSSLVDAAHRQRACTEASVHDRVVPRDPPHHAMFHARAMLATIALALAGPAVGAIQVGAPLGPEPQLSHAVARPPIAPATTTPRP
jgi:hypothetical protein